MEGSSSSSSAAAAPNVVITIDILSDPVCPWCFIGKRRMEKALAAVRESGEVEFRVRWLPFELRPSLPPEVVDMGPFCQEWLGSTRERVTRHFEPHFRAEGMELKLCDKMPNTFRAHRLLHLAGLRDKQDPLAEVLFSKYWLEGEDIGAIEVLSAAAKAVGMTDDVAAYLSGEEGAEAVIRQEKQQAAKRCTGVPLFIINDKHTLSGAASPSQFAALFAKVTPK
ncbi:Thiol oxidoreductase FrnE [Balamuthia mandrillaris]